MALRVYHGPFLVGWVLEVVDLWVYHGPFVKHDLKESVEVYEGRNFHIPSQS
jgi:hypothetical protein